MHVFTSSSPLLPKYGKRIQVFYNTFIIVLNCYFDLLQTFYNAVLMVFIVAVPRHECSNSINFIIKKCVGRTDFHGAIISCFYPRYF